MKKIILTLLTIVLFTNAKAEIGKGDLYAGFGINATSYLSTNGLSSGACLNFRAGLNFRPRLGVVVGFNKSFPVTFRSTEYAYAFSSWTNPSSIEFTSIHKVKFYDVNVRANLYIAGNADDGFGFYGHIGAAILGYKDQMQTGTYDTNLYYTTDSNDASMGFMIGGGLGLQYRSGIVGGFLEFGANVPATQVNGEDVSPVAVINAGLTLGVKIHFGTSDRD